MRFNFAILASIFVLIYYVCDVMRNFASFRAQKQKSLNHPKGEIKYSILSDIQSQYLP